MKSELLFIKGKYLDQDKIRICHIKSHDFLSFHKNIFNEFSHHIDPACEL